MSAQPDTVETTADGQHTYLVALPAECPVCSYPMRDPVYGLTCNGVPCDRDEHGNDAQAGHHWVCRACVLVAREHGITKCFLCKAEIAQIQTLDGAPILLAAKPLVQPEVSCEICNQTGHTVNDDLFQCAEDTCNHAWHQRCAKMSLRLANELRASDDRHV